MQYYDKCENILKGGAISISPDGKIGVEWNSYRMAWASTDIAKEDITGIDSPIIVNYGCSRDDKFEYVVS